MEAATDPLSDVFAALSVRTGSLSGVEATGRWALRFVPHEHVKIGVVLAGSCRLGVDGEPPMRMTAGDCFLLAAREVFQLSGEQDAPFEEADKVFLASPTRIVRVGDGPAAGGTEADGAAADGADGTAADGKAPGGAERGAADRTLVVGGSVHFLDGTVAMLLSGLPPLTVIRAGTGPARAIRPLLRLCMDEVEAARLGTTFMLGRLTEMLFVQAMRAIVEYEQEPEVPLRGWLGALGDPQIGGALLHMRREPARRWTVAELAGAVGMSRAAFAARFRQLVGMPPLEYLQRWRILTASKELLAGDRTVASVATAWGYSSEAAFSTAFKRITGVPPGRYRLDPNAAAPPPLRERETPAVFGTRPAAPVLSAGAVPDGHGNPAIS